MEKLQNLEYQDLTKFTGCGGSAKRENDNKTLKFPKESDSTGTYGDCYHNFSNEPGSNKTNYLACQIDADG